MSTPDEEQIRRMGLMYEGDHLGALSRLELICQHTTNGQAADMTRLLAASATRTGQSLQRLSAESAPQSSGPTQPPPKGTLPSPA